MKIGDKVTMLFDSKHTGRIATITHIGGLDLIEIRFENGEEVLTNRSAVARILTVDNEKPKFVNPFEVKK